MITITALVEDVDLAQYVATQYDWGVANVKLIEVNEQDTFAVTLVGEATSTPRMLATFWTAYATLVEAEQES